MRTLTRSEIGLVSGGINATDGAAVGAAIGGGIGLSYAISKGATATVALGAASIGAIGVSAVFASFGIGYSIGTYLYRYYSYSK